MNKLILIASLLFLSSCYQQIATISGTTQTIPVFTSKDIEVTYDFWGVDGRMSFFVYNNTDSQIYINWKNSAFILNDVKYPYWTDEYNSKAIGTNVYYGYGVSNNSAKIKTQHPEQITSIPPHSKIQKVTFKLYTASNYPVSMKKAKVGVEFTPMNTKIAFRNYLCYSFSEDVKSPVFITHGFYLSKINRKKSGMLIEGYDPMKFTISR